MRPLLFWNSLKWVRGAWKDLNQHRWKKVRLGQSLLIYGFKIIDHCYNNYTDSSSPNLTGPVY